MAFINWGEETPEQLKARKEMEERAMFEQMSYSAAMAAAAAAAGSGGIKKPSELIESVDWLTVAPGGEGSLDHDYENFDSWTTGVGETVIADVERLMIESTSASAHVHSDFAYSDLTIELRNKVDGQWTTVWSRRLVNPNYPGDDSEDFFMDGIDVVFPAIEAVNAIRVSSTPGSDQTYHDWGSDSTLFKFYK